MQNSKGIKWTGTSWSEASVGYEGDDILRGGGGNDTLAGAGGKDTFIFESSFAANGTDTIMDFKGRNATGGQDQLDLSLAINTSKFRPSNIGRYVWLSGDKLFVDTDGKGNADTARVWAVLKGVKQGDEIKIKINKFIGWITAGAPATLATPNAALQTDSTDGLADHNTDGITKSGAITAPTNTDNGATVEYQIFYKANAGDAWGTPSAWSSSYTAPTTDGYYRVDVRQNDGTQISAVQSIDFQLDTSADKDTPLSITFEDPDGYLYRVSGSANTSFSITGLDSDIDPSKVVMTILDKNESSVTATYNEGTGKWDADLTSLADGALLASVSVTDAAGNTASPSAAGTLVAKLPGIDMTVAVTGGTGGKIWVDTNGDGDYDAGENLLAYENSGWRLDTNDQNDPNGSDTQVGTNTITFDEQYTYYDGDTYDHFTALYDGAAVTLDSLIDLDDNAVAIKFYDFTTPKLDLTGFGLDDKIVLDMQDADRFMGISHNNYHADAYLTTWQSDGDYYGFYASNWAEWYYNSDSRGGSRTFTAYFSQEKLLAYAYFFNYFYNAADNSRSGTFTVATNLNIGCVHKQVQVLLPTPFDNW